ncbi:hypothetical protein DdX_18385 [Ditylenchus destructor]|uniref:F-box domain-containing protein n=1 Tax=Ditylenchus destructor TaxID=166010 RepID=A0AAD4MQ66_9BILA|nr:hypothetical protein DdX_18385 [Ditylenchus destructor]
MSCSKPLPPFTYELLCFLNRDQLERFTIVCRPLKNLIERYFHSKPYRIFNYLYIRGGSYALIHNDVRWHPNRNDYSVQQFLAAQKCNIGNTYYSFAEMRPYLGPTVRVKKTYIYVAVDSTYNPEHIEEMESIAYLWRDGEIRIWNAKSDGSLIIANDIQPILNSPIILQCRLLKMYNAHFSFKDYKILYTVKVIDIWHGYRDVNLNCWLEFLEQPGVKPIVALRGCRRRNIDIALDRLKQDFSSAISPNAFKIVFVQDESLTEFQETNKNTKEKLELKKGLPVEYQEEYLKYYDNYTLERSAI